MTVPIHSETEHRTLELVDNQTFLREQLECHSVIDQVSLDQMDEPLIHDLQVNRLTTRELLVSKFHKLNRKHV